VLAEEEREPFTMPDKKAASANQQETAVPSGELRMDAKGMIPSVARLRAMAPGLVADALAGVILLFVYAMLLSYLLPEGINQVFASKLRNLLPVPMVVLSLSVVLLARRRHRFAALPSPMAGFEARDLLLLLLPMAPIARYIVLNLDSLSAFHGVVIFCGFSALALLLTFILPMALSAFGSRNVMFMVGLAFSHTLFNMAAVASHYHWHKGGRLKIQLPLMALFFGLCLVLYCLDRRFLRTAACVLFAVCLVPGSGGPREIDRIEGNGNADRPKLQELTRGREPKHRPNIFLLTYESYVANETMLAYGIDNSSQENFLKEKGFHVYNGNWSVGASTLPSMSRMLGVRGWAYDAPVEGDGVVQTILAANGYRTFGVFPSTYHLQGPGSYEGGLGSYDYTFPSSSPASVRNDQALLLCRQILVGGFRSDAIYESIDYKDYLYEKKAVLERKGSEPRFLYTHNVFPGHAQGSGKATGNELALYRESLVHANLEMIRDVTTAIKHNPSAVVIVCGDHGPSLTKNCTRLGGAYDISDVDRLDIQSRYGCFLAIRWPEGASIDHGRIEILQDVFPAVFSWMYEDPTMWGLAMEKVTRSATAYTISGARVRNGMIEGGVDDGRPLFESRGDR
jgi:hypothetical protein